MPRIALEKRSKRHINVIAKLEAYRFHINALKLIYGYLPNRKERIKVNDAHSSWKDISYGIQQVPILGPLLFNIHLCDLFNFMEDLDIASYADDTTIYTVNEKKKSQSLVHEKQETSSSLLFGWLSNNFRLANSNKSHLIMTCTEATAAMIDGLPIDSRKTSSSRDINRL